MKKLSLLLLYSIFSLGLVAQPYTWETCRKMALDNNATLRDKRVQEEMAEQMKKQAMTFYFPNVSAIGMGFTAADPLISLDLGMLGNMAFLKDGLMASAMAVQPVFMGGKIFYSNKLAKLGVTASKLFTRQSEDQVLAQTDEYYWTLVTLYEKRKTVAVMTGVLDSLYKDVTQAKKAGVLGQNDVLKVQLEQHSLSSKRIELENGIFLCKMALARQMGMRVDSLDGFDVLPPADSLYTTPSAFYMEPAQALVTRTEYELLQTAVKAATLEKRIERANYLPQVAVGAAYYYENLLDKNNTNGALMAGVRVPISDWWRGAYALRHKQLAEQRAMLQQEDGQQQLLMQIQQAWGAFTEAYEQLQVANLSVAASEENARLNREFFHAGTVSLTELLAAQGYLQVSYDNRTEAVKKYHVAKNTYLQVTGRDVR